VTGLLTEPENSSALAEAILHLTDDRALARAMGRAGRERAEQMYSWQSIAGVLKARYAALCSTAPSVSAAVSTR